jgi:peptide-methionine (S)-S-oxide reductase
MGALAALVLSSCALAQSAQKTSSGTITPTAKTPPLPAGRQVATFAGGCFWAMQTEFKQLRGVDSVVAGYAGGNVPHPSYEVVCSGMTGHAETVQIIFDPKVITYTDLLRIFFTDIDPTTLNQQGNDSGTQYRSVIFYHDVAQRDAARKVIKEITAKKLYPDPIVTEVVPYKNFYAAEDYHQDYCTHNPGQPYCANVVASEVQRFVKMNRERLKTVGVAAVP